MAAAKPKPRERAEWHLICVTRKGKVSMLQNLTLTVARETYQRLLPDTHPEKHYPPKCKKDDPHGWGMACKSDSHRGGYMSSGREKDRLERVDVVGPKGQELKPWAGVKPREIRHHCRCHLPRVEYRAARNGGVETITLLPLMPETPKAPAPLRWDRKRSDFWNHPRLWDRVKDPFKQMCWETVR